jgi:hypothetical protein
LRCVEIQISRDRFWSRGLGITMQKLVLGG